MQDHSERPFPPTSLADMKSENTQWLKGKFCVIHFFFPILKSKRMINPPVAYFTMGHWSSGVRMEYGPVPGLGGGFIGVNELHSLNKQNENGPWVDPSDSGVIWFSVSAFKKKKARKANTHVPMIQDLFSKWTREAPWVHHLLPLCHQQGVQFCYME